MLNNRPKTRRVLMTLCAVAVAWYMGLFACGAVRFPRAPYRSCGTDTYCDKLGQQRSKAEFEAFSRWERLFIWSVPLGFVAGGIVLRLRQRK
ncbi:MAG TPA: hypothetical protein VN201_11945 [Roseateles sp.]|nr:hypothetical protein [Roseateles sp.]